jgi:hypothetical protein
MIGAQRSRRPSACIQLSPKQANILHMELAEGRPLPLRGVRPAVGSSRMQLRDLVLAAFHTYI